MALTVGAGLLGTSTATAEPTRIAFLATEASLDVMNPHNRAAWDVAQGVGDAALLFVNAQHGFVDSAGAARALGDFDVAWYHQGGAIARNSLYGGPALDAVRAYADGGGGVLLSGGALALVAQLGLEPGGLRPQRRALENYRDPAFMVRVEREHPVFEGLEEKDGLIGLSGGGCPAVADFYWGGPAEGMVLANTPDRVQRPLVEYEAGPGRIIVFGWRWPDYGDGENPYRANLLRLTGNLLAYLADAPSWRPVILRSAYPPVAHPDEPGIAAARWRALRMAIEDLSGAFPDTYAEGAGFLGRLNALKAEHDRVPADGGAEALGGVVTRFEALQREALVANPLLDFDKLLLIRRRAGRLGLPANFNGNADLPPTGYDNTLVSIDPKAPAAGAEVVFRPSGDRFIGDVDLHYDAEKALLSIPNEAGRWGVAELDLASGTLAPLPLIDEPDVHNYDACYVPDGRIVFTSTAPFTGVPCVGGRSKVANLYLRGHDGGIRRLTHDQDHNWCPAVLNNGRILYQRWEYSDIAHAFMRILFHANPDGSHQMEYYGSNSFWPTALFYARPIPGHPTQIVAVAGGHHGTARQGELVILDPALGRHEANGVVQRIPGYGERVEPVILDSLVDASWPRFLHPFPLSEKYFLVSCKPTENANWGVYLVDMFDNFVLLYEEPGWAMLEPVPWRKTARQPVVADIADPAQHAASVMMVDVYEGPGLAGVPRGTVKALRLSSYDFTYHELGGEPDRVGLDGPWDVRRVLGTVPVAEDGSAYFRVPPCTPIAVQPLDAEGKALALMRSWFTAAPGEVLSCVGCHEKQNMTAPCNPRPEAFRAPPSAIEPWYGPARGFSFEREVQPVLDAYCIGCHHGGELPGGRKAFDLTAKPAERVASAFQMHFSPSYMALRRWVHTPTLESDAHLLPPRDFHADTSKLVQILRDGHHGVRLSAEAWDRLIVWIDLNAPFHGTWPEVVASNEAKRAAALHGAERRRALHQRYAGIDVDFEAVLPAAELEAVPPQPLEEPVGRPEAVVESGAPVPAPKITSIEIGDGVALPLARIEPGAFTMGSDDGYPNERPAHGGVIERPFLMGCTEVTNAQYACFDPSHESGLETGEAYQFGDDERGFTLSRPEQPVVRVSWDEAMTFCAWLTEQTGKQFGLPTETQWEYACRAGTASPLWYGAIDDDFSEAANLSDATHYTVYYPHVPTALPPWRPADARFDDGWRVAAPCGLFTANPWGLRDMHGNVAEWTSSDYGFYPGAPDGAANQAAGGVRKVVRGGSWLDRPKRARSAFRLHYAPSQAVHDVGFRVVCAAQDDEAATAPKEAPKLRHSADWVRTRLLSMLAVDDACLWHDVLEGRAIHQNSSANPPTEPLEGNFHTQQQSFFALMKMHIHEALGLKDDKQVDDAKVLLDWVLDNGYDDASGRFYFRYNTKEGDWNRNFYPEFNMITVAALLRYDALRPAPRYVAAANRVFDTIISLGWDTEHGGFMSGFSPNAESGELESEGKKGLYGSGYLAIMMLDAYGATGEARFLEWARKSVDSCNTHLWDAEHGAWLAGANRDWSQDGGTTKLTHVIADMIQANYRLYLLGQGTAYRDYAEKALGFLIDHCRAPNGLWYRHTTRDGADPAPGPDLDADGGPGTCYPYDRQMQVVTALCLGWEVTGNADYLAYIDDTLDGMEQHHRIDYPAGINYGYMGKDNAQNTWCHLWGLKGLTAVARIGMS